MGVVNHALKELSHNENPLHIPAGQSLIRREEPYAHVYILQYGAVEMCPRKEPHTQILHVLSPLALLPFAFFSGPAVVPRWEYISLTDCTVAAIPAEDLRKRLEDNGRLAMALTRWFSSQVHELIARLDSLGRTDTKGKMLAAFTFLARHHKRSTANGWIQLSFPLSRQFIADMTGVTREGVSMNMPYFLQHGLVRTAGHASIELSPRLLAS